MRRVGACPRGPVRRAGNPVRGLPWPARTLLGDKLRGADDRNHGGTVSWRLVVPSVRSNLRPEVEAALHQLPGESGRHVQASPLACKLALGGGLEVGFRGRLGIRTGAQAQGQGQGDKRARGHCPDCIERRRMVACSWVSSRSSALRRTTQARSNAGSHQPMPLERVSMPVTCRFQNTWGEWSCLASACVQA